MSTRVTRSASKSPSPLGTPGSTPITSKGHGRRKRPRDSQSKFSPVSEETPDSEIPVSSDIATSDLFTPTKDRPPGASPPSARRKTDAYLADPSSPLPLVTSPGVGGFSSPLVYPQPSGLVRAIKDLEISSPLSYFSEGVGLTPRGSGVEGTPLRPRGDIQSEGRLRTVTIGEGGSSQADTRNDSTQVHSVIWGTDVNIQETKDSFKSFISSFLLPPNSTEQLDEDTPLYLQKLEEIQVLEDPFLNISCDHLSTFNHNLYLQLVRYPQEVIPAFDQSANELFFSLYPDSELEHQIQVRPFNVDKTRNMRMLNPEDIDQLITVSGMIIRSSSIIPEMRQAYFECHICQKGLSGLVERGRVTEPSVCPGCQTLHSMQLIHNRSLFSDKQLLKLQESPDDMPPGQTPHTIALYAHNDLVDSAQPGDKLSITGIYRATPLRVNPRTRNLKSVYRTYVDVIHFRRTDLKRLRGMDEGGEETGTHPSDPSSIRHGPLLSSERVAELKHLSQSPDIYERLSRALAPSIYENQDIKKGILLQLLGGCKKDEMFKEAGRGQFRADINILLCGDPGTSKSQLLQYVHRLMPRSQYTSGKGSSAVGLTAYVTKDPETRQLVLQTGALALSDNGVCCIDEFDKMTDSTRSILHEVMEQQTLSIAKAGIICSINARTSILAAANPRMSAWDHKLTTVENIQLPHTLISRFDLIFLMLDPQDEFFDRRLAHHLVSLYNIADPQNIETEDVDMQILRDYIAYARSYVLPKLSEEAGQALIQAYVDMRKIGSSRGAVTAYPRQLESLIRLSESHSRMRFSQVVEVLDVEEAKRLHREALKQSAMDPKTGIIDVSILTTGISASERSRKVELAGELYKLLQKMEGKTHSLAKIMTHFQEKTQKHITDKQLEDAMKLLRDEEKVMIQGKQIRLS